MNDQETIDWRAIRESLQWDDSSQQQGLLRQRAKQYAAAPHADESSAADTLSVLTFELSGERYGVDVMLVRAVRPLPKITPVPATPRFYKGVVNLRGQLVTVLDLRSFFEMADPTRQDPPRELIIVRANQLEIGLLVKTVIGVTTVPQAAIRPFEQLRYARGVTPDRLVLLDIARLFEDERLIVRDTEE